MTNEQKEKRRNIWESHVKQWKFTIIKILYWDKNGFCLWQKRLEKGKYFWPEKESDIYQTFTTKTVRQKI